MKVSRGVNVVKSKLEEKRERRGEDNKGPSGMPEQKIVHFCSGYTPAHCNRTNESMDV